jgi:tRNA pseudouridine55 synthase
MGHSKTYIAEICFGASTDTLDSYGCVTESKPTSVIDEQQLAEACTGFLGGTFQVPPDYSAVKISGRKSYELARKGISVKKEPREICVEVADVLACTGPGRFLLRVRCSKGTYVRTLISDIAHAMGEIAYTSFLLRIESGQYHVQTAYTLDEIADMAEKSDYSFLQSAESVVGELPSLELEDIYTFALENGQTIRKAPPADVFRLYCGGKFYGIGCCAGDALRLKIPLY